MNIPTSLEKAYNLKDKKQVQLAAGINVTKSYVSAIETSIKPAPIGFIVKCALFFNMKVSEFIALGEE
ncbi:MAG: helix-turn-helix transcriptional regulator [Gammaproteobacteria bacterium]|nr:helix-turn-helix transcriptional regulator [Gammaproteobacteria bacterium]